MMSFAGLAKQTLESNLTTGELTWLLNSIAAGLDNEKALQTTFVAIPRHIRRSSITLDPLLERSFFSISTEGWTSHQYARAYVLIHFPAQNERKYVQTLTTLFETAEINELVALYSSLSLLHYPKSWLSPAKEAVRTNMGPVFDAIAFGNPYPFEHFEEAAWNQMVLKTIFNGKSIRRIHRLKERTNPELALMLSDFAHERWAAGRSVSSEVWELVSPFLDHRLIRDIEKLFLSEKEDERSAARLCCIQSDFGPAKDLLKKHRGLFAESPNNLA